MAYINRFPKTLHVSPAKRNGYWVIGSIFMYIPTQKVSKTAIIVPVGFETNFASIPRIFRNIIQQWGKHGNAAIIHDYLYSIGCSPNVTRKKADQIFLNAMKYSKVGFFKRQLMYRTVRLFGKMNWKKEGI